MRSAVFLPTPGIFTSCSIAPLRIAAIRSAPARPLIAVTASFGPMPLTVINFSNSDLSAAETNPNSDSASSRTCVWMCSDTSCPAAGSEEYTETGMVTS